MSINAIRDLLAKLADKDKRIAELEKQVEWMLARDGCYGPCSEVCPFVSDRFGEEGLLSQCEFQRRETTDPTELFEKCPFRTDGKAVK